MDVGHRPEMSKPGRSVQRLVIEMPPVGSFGVLPGQHGGVEHPELPSTPVVLVTVSESTCRMQYALAPADMVSK